MAYGSYSTGYAGTSGTAWTFQNTFEGGTNGTQVTTLNSGGASGDAFSDVATGTGATTSFSNAHVMHGTMALAVGTGTAWTDAFVDWALSTADTTFYTRAYLYVATMPTTAEEPVISIRSAGSECARVVLTTSGSHLKVYGASASPGTMTTTLSTATWYRVEMKVLTATSNATIEVKLFSGDSLTPLETVTYTTAVTTATADTILFGAPNTNSGPVYYLDDIGTSNQGYLGPTTTTASGSLTLGGSVSPGTTAGSSGSLSLSGYVGVAAQNGSITLSGSGGSVPTSASGSLTFGGSAYPIAFTYTNGAESGVNNTTVTVGNSGGATSRAFDGVVIGPGGTFGYTNLHPNTGTLGFSCATTPNWTDSYAYWLFPAPDTQVYARAYLYLTSTPTVESHLMTVRSGSTTVGQLTVNTSRQLTLHDGSGSTWTMATAIPLGQMVRVEFKLLCGAAGTLETKLFLTASSTTASATYTTSASLAATADRILFGLINANSAPTFFLDDLGASDQGYLGPVGSGTAYTITQTDTSGLTDPSNMGTALTVGTYGGVYGVTGYGDPWPTDSAGLTDTYSIQVPLPSPNQTDDSGLTDTFAVVDTPPVPVLQPLGVALRGDLTGTPFGQAPTLTDFTGYLELGADGQNIEITVGRQDQFTDVQPSQFTFVLTNPDGAFTTGAYPIGPNAYFAVVATLDGVEYPRVAGYVDQVETLWPGGSSSYCQVRVTCTDILGRLGEGTPMLAMYDHEVLADSPQWFYPLQEVAGASCATDTTGTAPALQVVASPLHGAATLTFGDSAGNLFDRTGVAFDSPNAGTGTDGPLSILSVNAGRNSAAMPVPPSGMTFEIVVSNLTAPASNAILAAFFSADANVLIQLELQADGTVTHFVGTAPGVYSESYALPVCDGGVHHIAGVILNDSQTTLLYVDGRKAGCFHLNGAPMDFSNLAYICLGGQILPNGKSRAGVKGTIGAFALFGSVLPDTRITAHAQAAIGSGPVESSDSRFGRLLSYQGVTATGLPTGVAAVAAQATRGKTVAEALKTVTDSEGTPLFATLDGQPTFQARNYRYWAAPAFVLDQGDVQGTVTPRVDRVGLLNVQTATRDRGATQQAQDNPSIAKYGKHEGGALTVCCTTDRDALHNCHWRVATGKDARVRFSSAPIDLLTQPNHSLVAAILQAGIGDRFDIGGMPAQTPGGSTAGLFIEGWKESIGKQVWTVEAFTSAAASVPQTLRASASPSASTKLDAGLKIPF